MCQLPLEQFQDEYGDTAYSGLPDRRSDLASH